MRDVLDRPAAVRPGEELDLKRLAEYLRRIFPDLAGPIELEQFPSGYSNLTYLVRVAGSEMVVRRPPVGSRVQTAHDMGREYRILSQLHPVFELAPRPLAFCDDAGVLGAPFYLMERVRGLILRREPPPGLELTPETVRALGEAFVRQLVRLHTLDYEAAGLGDLGKPEGYVERQVNGWRRRYFGSQTDDIPEIEEIADWLVERLPGESGASLIHNDYKYDNLVLDPVNPTRIRALLDWEMATIGDPLMDLGSSLAYWVEASDPEPLLRFRFVPTHLPGSLTRREVAALYARLSGASIENLAYYYCFGLFRLAVIAQQIYYRYRKGLTRDERFAPMIDAIRVLGRTALRVAETEEV
ncbi:MAG: phosphotransferase family protein [Thermoanaerobaculia bacterium]